MAASINNMLVKVSSANAARITAAISRKWWFEFAISSLIAAGVADKMPADVEKSLSQHSTEMSVLKSILSALGFRCPDTDIIGFQDWIDSQDSFSDLQKETTLDAAEAVFQDVPMEGDDLSTGEEIVSFSQAMGEGVLVRASALQRVLPLIVSKLNGAWTLGVKASCGALSNKGRVIEKTDSQIRSKFIEAQEWAKVIRWLGGNPDDYFSPEDKVAKIESWTFQTEADRSDCLERFGVKGFGIPAEIVGATVASGPGSAIQNWAAKLEAIRATKKA